MSTLKRLFGRLSGAADEAPPSAPAPSSHEAPSRAAITASPNAGSREAVVRALAAHIASQSENKLTLDAIDPDAEMCDHGYLDSFTYVSFLVFIEETYGVRIPDHQLTGKLKTVSAVADFILRGSKNG